MNPDSASLDAIDPLVKQMLREDLPNQSAELEKALRTADINLAIEIVHGIHGSAAFCRLESLRFAAARLESALRNGQSDPDLIEAFQRDLQGVLRLLQDNRSSQGAKE